MGESVRLDKWLWAARFFRTRSMAAKEVELGRVTVMGERVKPARAVRVGDQVAVRKGVHTIEVEVLAISDKRGPAAQAEKLYRETPESAVRRAEVAEAMRLENADNAGFRGRGRPTKKDRRELMKVRRFARPKKS